MPEEERTAYFEEYIEQLKAAEEAKEAEKKKRASAGYAAFSETQGGKENQGKFYFYNITSLGYGKTDFKTRWGERPLEDDWRWSNKTRIAPSEATAELVTADTEATATAEERYTVAFYLDQLPQDQATIDSLAAERNFANYQLGLIYKEKFKENLLAAGKLEAVLSGSPEERLILPSKYNLYKIYAETGSPLAADMKQNIISNHPDSRYAELLLNPQAVLADNQDSADALYTKLFRAHQEQQYLQVITQSQELINRFTGDPIAPKLEMLKANAIGRLQGFEPYKEALNFVALTYPNTPEGKKAEQIIAEQLPKLESKDFLPEESSAAKGNWKVVFAFDKNTTPRAEKLKNRLEEAIEKLRYNNRISRDIYNLEQQFVVVHGFKSKDFALGFAELIKNNRNYRIKDENFVILSKNYQTILIHKNLEAYMAQMLTPKP